MNAAYGLSLVLTTAAIENFRKVQECRPGLYADIRIEIDGKVALLSLESFKLALGL